jgi:hypothetical protein
MSFVSRWFAKVFYTREKKMYNSGRARKRGVFLIESEYPCPDEGD